jgi:RHS repeat-associated protein
MHSVSLKFLVGILSFSDYYPFGMQMPNRNASTGDYRYGFQGQETDNEVTGSESHVSYKYRMHDARLGRFLSIDPLAPDYPHNSPYAFSENRVIDGVELEGLEVVDAGKDFTVAGFAENADQVTNVDRSRTFSSEATRAEDLVLFRAGNSLDGYGFWVASKIHDGRDRYGELLYEDQYIVGPSGYSDFMKNPSDYTGWFGLGLEHQMLNAGYALGGSRNMTFGGFMKKAWSPMNIVGGFTIGAFGLQSLGAARNNIRAGNTVNFRSLEAHSQFQSRSFGLNANQLVERTLSSTGTVSRFKLEGLIPPGTPNTFMPSPTIQFGDKFAFRYAGKRVELKWHSADMNAAARFPGSNSAIRWTGQIKVGNKLLGLDGNWHRRPSNLTHIPLNYQR